MKTPNVPDKIYVAHEYSEIDVLPPGVTSTRVFNKDVEYIRKETERIPKPELTIKDLELLHTFLYAVKNNKHGCFTFTSLSEEQYAEILKRFKEAKK